MDWMHCNMCYAQPRDSPKRQYILTSCGHIFCLFCENTGEEIIECKICKNKCNTTRIYGQMAPDIQMFFEDPDDIKIKLEKVIDFQRAHRIRLNEYRKFVVMEFQRAQKEVVRLREEFEAVKRTIEFNARKVKSRTQETQSAKVGPPLLQQYSQLSEAIRARSNNIYSNEQQFRTSTPYIGSSFNGYRYYPQVTTPGTTSGTTPDTAPGTPSYLANSPASVLYKPQGITPRTPLYMRNSPASALDEKPF